MGLEVKLVAVVLGVDYIVVKLVEVVNDSKWCTRGISCSCCLCSSLPWLIVTIADSLAGTLAALVSFIYHNLRHFWEV